MSTLKNNNNNIPANKAALCYNKKNKFKNKIVDLIILQTKESFKEWVQSYVEEHDEEQGQKWKV